MHGMGGEDEAESLAIWAHWAERAWPSWRSRRRSQPQQEEQEALVGVGVAAEVAWPSWRSRRSQQGEAVVAAVRYSKMCTFEGCGKTRARWPSTTSCGCQEAP